MDLNNLKYLFTEALKDPDLQGYELLEIAPNTAEEGAMTVTIKEKNNNIPLHIDYGHGPFEH